MQVLTNQEFTYRESPAEQDGYGKFKALYGNTLVWNQLYKNTNIPTSQTKNEVTITNNNDGSWTLNGTATANTYFYGYNGDIKPIVGHKYLMKDCVPNGVSNFYCVFDGARINATQNNSIVTATSVPTGGNGTAFAILNGATVNVTFHPQIFDLTQMGLDSLTVEEFTSLFPKPYYEYTAGKLLPFGVNDLVSNGTFETIGDWKGNRCSLSVASHTLTATINNASGGQYVYLPIYNVKANHRYNVSFELELSADSSLVEVRFYNPDTGLDMVSDFMSVTANTKTRLGTQMIPTVSGDVNSTTMMLYFKRASSTSDLLPVGTTAKISNFKCIDLDGVGIKTVGKNRLNNDNQLWGTYGTTVIGYNYSFNRLAPYLFEIEFAKGQTYTISYLDDGVLDSGDYLFVGVNQYANGTRIADSGWQRMPYSFTVNELTDTVRLTFRKSNANASCEGLVAYVGNKLFFQLEYGSTASSYEPYTESALSIPLDEFPDGMDGINDIRDEKNETGYVKRRGTIVLNGSEAWSLVPTSYNAYIDMPIMKGSADYTLTMLCDKLDVVKSARDATVYDNPKWVSGYPLNSGNNNWLYIHIDGITTLADLRSWLQTNPVTVNYELRTPLENYGVVDLGSLEWGFNSTNSFFYANVVGGIANYGLSIMPNILCDKYATVATRYGAEFSSVDKVVTWSRDSSQVQIKDTSYTDVNAFKQAMSGVYLLYEKENPQGLIYPPQSKEEYPFFKSYKGGTEQLLPENGSVPVTAPILADMNYSSGAIEVTTFPNPEQGGETSGDGWYLVGEEATVNALPNEHYAFNNWVLDGEIVSTDPEYTFEVQDE